MRPTLRLFLLTALVTSRALATEGEVPAAEAGAASAPATTGAVAPRSAPVPSEVTPLFTQDRDNYFLTGVPNPFDLSRPRVRFQVSIKYNLAPQRAGWGLFFGYTQKAIWDLWNWSGSSPFEDSNYNPSLFWGWRPGGFLRALEPVPGWRVLGLRLGGEHESNGQAGAISRSWNRIGGAVKVGHFSPTPGDSEAGRDETHYWHVIGDLKGWYAFKERREAGGGGNPDILRYYGYGQASLELGYDVPVTSATASRPHYHRLFGVGVMGRVGDRLDRGYLEAWLRVRPRWFGWLGSSLFVQYVVGYGETLLRYDVRQAPTVRVGISLDDLLSTDST
jgi:phospholipase A1